MASDPEDVQGNWYGMMVHYPSRGVIHVSFVGENGSFKGKWDFPGLSRGAAKQGAFSATRFANWLNVRIRTKPFVNVQCQLTILKDKGKSMMAGVIPLEDAEIPFATVTLFRHEPPECEMSGICPVIEFSRKRVSK
jgi:hypothetical protein